MKRISFLLTLIFLLSFGFSQAATLLFPTGGGTGWGNIQSGALVYGQGTNRVATTTQGTGGYVLSWSGGIPTWVATTTFSNGLTYANGNAGLDLGNANTWTALQQFNANASTTMLSALSAYFGGTATSTFSTAGDLTLASWLNFDTAVATSSALSEGTVVWNGSDFYGKTTATSSDWKSFTQSNDIDVFLVGGQSNAVGTGNVRGPTTTPGTVYQYYNGVFKSGDDPVGGAGIGSMWPQFGITYHQLTGRKVLLVPVAEGGASLTTEAQSVGKRTWDTTDTLFDEAVAIVHNATTTAAGQGFIPHYKGVVWVQGETDGDAIRNSLLTPAVYYTELIALQDRFQVALGTTSQLFIVRTGTRTGVADSPGLSDVRAQQDLAAYNDKDIHMIYRGAVDFPWKGWMDTGSDVHYGNDGLNDIGLIGGQYVANLASLLGPTTRSGSLHYPRALFLGDDTATTTYAAPGGLLILATTTGYQMQLGRSAGLASIKALDTANAGAIVIDGDTSGTNIGLVGLNFYSTGNVALAQGGGNAGVGTSTPWGKLSVTNTGTGPSFMVEDSTSPDSTPFIVDASGRVGIGTTSPVGLLDITSGEPRVHINETGNANSALSQSMTGLSLNGGNINPGVGPKYTAALKFGSTDTNLTTYNPKFLAGIVGRATEAYGVDSSSGMALDFLTTANNAGTAPTPTVGMTLSEDGNVGIGTTSPAVALDVWGAISATGNVSVAAGNNYNKYCLWGSADTTYCIGMVEAQTFGYLNDYAMTFGMSNNANRGWLWRDTSDATSDGAMSLTTDGRFAVKSTANFQGSVGIGTTSPAALLDITAGTAGTNGRILFSPGTGGNNRTLTFNTFNSGGVAYSGIDSTGTNSGSAASLVLNLSGGNVGIGTSTPIANFQVTTASANATTSVQFGKPNQNKGTCLTFYDTAGAPVYWFIATGATDFTKTSTKPSGCQN